MLEKEKMDTEIFIPLLLSFEPDKLCTLFLIHLLKADEQDDLCYQVFVIFQINPLKRLAVPYEA
jgi:hypothetical protein